MESFKLPFAEIKIIHNNIAEVIINEGIEMDLSIVKQYHKFLLNHLTVPFSLLINKINAYSYTFEAQIELATLKEINAMAVVTYNYHTKVATQYLAELPRKRSWHIEIFNDRSIALNWLTQQ